MNFLFFIFLIGTIIAVFQDFKRREIDDWLNLLLLFSGIFYLIFQGEFSIYSFPLFLFFMAGISFLFYFARAFAGGDAKLLFAMTPLFYNVIFYNSLINLLFFIFCLFFAGSVYTLFFAGFIFIRDSKKLKKPLKENLKKVHFHNFLVFAGIFFILGFFYKILFIFCFLLMFFPILYSLALSLDKISMVRQISSKDIREGDWIIKKIKVGKELIYPKWEGVSKEEVSLIKRINEQILVKDGIPFALSFLLALSIYYFKDIILSLFF